MRRAIAALADVVGRRPIKLISVDVFDTLLLRTTVPEPARFRAIARRQAARLAETGVSIDPEVLLVARLMASHLAYRVGAAPAGEREGRHGDIVAITAAAAGLDAASESLLREVELDYERETLTGNHALAAALAGHRAGGKRVVFASDMYFGTDAIAGLIADRLPALTLDGGYSSADCGATKRGGGLFRILAEREGVAPEEIVHLGDHPLADGAVPRSLGLATVATPRPAAWRGVHRARRVAAVLALRRMLRAAA